MSSLFLDVYGSGNFLVTLQSIPKKSIYLGSSHWGLEFSWSHFNQYKSNLIIQVAVTGVLKILGHTVCVFVFGRVFSSRELFILMESQDYSRLNIDPSWTCQKSRTATLHIDQQLPSALPAPYRSLPPKKDFLFHILIM